MAGEPAGTATVTSVSAIRGEQLARYLVYGTVLETGVRLMTPLSPTHEPADVVFDMIDVPPVEEQQWGSPLRQRPGEFALYRVGRYDVLRFEHEAVFFLTSDRISCLLLEGSRAGIAEIRLLGGALSYWLESKGVPTLHASAVVVDGRAVAFASGNGGGKTSVAAELMRAGYELLTDDILPLELTDGRVFGRSGYPQMRMWPAEASHFLGEIGDLAKVHPAFDKLRVPVGPDGFGRFRASPAEIGAVYLLDPVDGRQPPVFEPIPPQQRLVLLASASFAAEVSASAPCAEQRLRTLGHLAAHTPVWWLSYGRSDSTSAQLAEAVVVHMRSGAPVATRDG